MTEPFRGSSCLQLLQTQSKSKTSHPQISRCFAEHWADFCGFATSPAGVSALRDFWSQVNFVLWKYYYYLLLHPLIPSNSKHNSRGMFHLRYQAEEMSVPSQDGPSQGMELLSFFYLRNVSFWSCVHGDRTMWTGGSSIFWTHLHHAAYQRELGDTVGATVLR